MDERSKRDLAAIKEQEAAMRAAIQRGDPEVDVGALEAGQLGLRWVFADQWGRLWRDDGDKFTLIFNPEAKHERGNRRRAGQ